MHHITGELFGNTVHLDTLYFAWALMILTIIGAVFLSSGVSKDIAKYSKRQIIAETLYNFVRGTVREQIGKKRGEAFVFFIGSIFLFILINYYAGLFPWKIGSLLEWWPQIPVHEAGAHGHHAVHNHPWHGASPCADINIPAGMALLVILAYFGTGISIAGFDYVQSFLPINIKDTIKGKFFAFEGIDRIQILPLGGKAICLNILSLLELMDLIIRPLTLSLRLFANTVAGETLLATFIGLVALILPVFVLGFEMAVGLLQSFLFMILSTVYIAVAVQHAEHMVHDSHH